MTKESAEAKLSVDMNKFGRYIVVAVISLSLITGSAAALTRKVKDSGSNKAKAADTVKQTAPAKPATSTAEKPAAPAKADSTNKRKVTPAKFNDFLDANKNGIDDRAEKCNPEAKKAEPKKPAPTATPAKKPAETKKSVSPSAIKVSPKKSK
ncbi:MAG: hypothetical protein WBP29_11705 [Candidatus Zixiibacteriota bacterium]